MRLVDWGNLTWSSVSKCRVDGFSMDPPDSILPWTICYHLLPVRSFNSPWGVCISCNECETSLLECYFLKDRECKIHFYILSLTKHMTRWVCHTVSWKNRWEWDWASFRDSLTQISRSLKALITYYKSSAVLGGGQGAADSIVEERAIEGWMHMFCGGLGPRAVRILESLFFLTMERGHHKGSGKSLGALEGVIKDIYK